MKKAALIFLLGSSLGLKGQTGYWQQRVDYSMDVVFDVNTHTYTGTQTISYFNNSPDTLREIYLHLYFNAFQPNSMMDERQRNLPDPDGRIGSRILALTPAEQGFQQITSLDLDGAAMEFEVRGTVLKALLPSPILPGTNQKINLTYKAQVPIQIRRSGRNNAEGIDYTMTQWYPKMAAYDKQGWHPDPYLAREFYSDFGTFDVKINIDSRYVLAGSGVVKNPCEVGHGYCGKKKIKRKVPQTWHFKADSVHDFAWAADPEYTHDILQTEDGKTLRFFYLKDVNGKVWKEAQPYAARFFNEMQTRFGTYPYKEFAFIMGGDGGMEYPNCTMLKGTGELKGMVGVMVHEAAHNWYYGMLATNEQAFPWMDEGFTTFAEDEVMAVLFPEEKAHSGTKKAVAYYMGWDGREPLATPADRFNTNPAYGLSSYSMGSMFLLQIRGMVGEEAFWKGMKSYYDQWAFKHPYPEDFVRVMEESSGLKLQWFLQQWVYQTRTINYGIAGARASGNRQTAIELSQGGGLHTPVEVAVYTKSGGVQQFWIPNAAVQGSRLQDEVVLSPWPWTHPAYTFTIDLPLQEIERIEIDPREMTADFKRKDNVLKPEE